MKAARERSGADAQLDAPEAATGGASAMRRQLAGMSFEAQQQAVTPDKRGGGQDDPAWRGMLDPAMPLPFRAQLEEAFDADLSEVVAHSGPNAAAANQELGSKAFTRGEHIVFATQAPDLGLVAHEVAHAVQQGAVKRRSEPGEESVGSLEDEADAAALAVQRGEPVHIAGNAPVQVQTWAGREHRTLGDAAWSAVHRDYQNNAAIGGLMGDVDQAVAVRQRGGPERGKKTHISYGEANRRAGDHAFTPEQLRRGVGEQGTKDPAKRAGEAPHTAALAKREWEAFHKAALKAASQAAAATDEHARKAAFDEAIRQESFGAHFLEDAFSSGHQTTKDLAWYAGASARETRKADRLGGQRYHDWFNANGLDLTRQVPAEDAAEPSVQTPPQELVQGAGMTLGAPVPEVAPEEQKETYQAYGDGALKNAAATGYDQIVTQVVEQSLRQVVAVAAGELALPDAMARVPEVLAMIPHLDAEGLEQTRARDAGWLKAAVVETMVAGYQKIHDRAKGSGTKKRTQSGVAVSGKRLTSDESVEDLFDGELAGLTGKAADRERIVRDLEFLEATLEDPWVGAGGEKERGMLARELVASLKVRIEQFEAHVKGEKPEWLRALKARLQAWQRRIENGDVKDGAKRAVWRSHVLELLAAIPGANA